MLNKTILIGSSAAFLALAAAVPAAADDQDFADALEIIGVAVDGPGSAGAMGRSACARLDGGDDVVSTVNALAASHGLDLETAALVVGFSVAEYCDHHEGALGR